MNTVNSGLEDLLDKVSVDTPAKKVKGALRDLKKRLAEAVSQPSTTQDSSNPAYEIDEFGVSDANARMWAVYGHTFTPCEKAIKKLVPGQYTINHDSSRGIFFEQVDVNLDELLVLPDTESETVLAHIEDFWSKEERYRKLGFLWKRGILLWGSPGTGKTSTVQLLSKMIVDKGGLAIYIGDPALAARGLDLLRRIEPKRPIVAILEDLDAIISSNRHTEADILSLIDGELQIDNIVFVATTNYPEELDQRIINRPSRFDVVKEIKMPNAEARRMFLEYKNERLAKPEHTEELTNWVKLTNDFSLAHIKEMIICVECYEQDYTQVAKVLRKMIDVKPESHLGKNIGFSGN